MPVNSRYSGKRCFTKIEPTRKTKALKSNKSKSRWIYPQAIMGVAFIVYKPPDIFVSHNFQALFYRFFGCRILPGLTKWYQYFSGVSALLVV